MSKNKAKVANQNTVAQVSIPKSPELQNQSDAILQLSAQANATKQLVDELVNANVGLRSQYMLVEHHLNSAKEINSNLVQENTSLKSEVEALKKQISNFEDAGTNEANQEDSDQESAA